MLFEALVANGMPRQNSPVAAMLMEHDQGRPFVQAMEAGALKALPAKRGRNSLSPRTPLPTRRCCASISPGRMILYPLAERVLPEAVRPAITAGYRRAEAAVGTDFTARYTRIIEGYDSAPRAAIL